MRGAASGPSHRDLTGAIHKHTCAASLLADLVQMHSLSCFALTLITTPQISSPSVNCSPMHASSCSADAHILQSCRAPSDTSPETLEMCFQCACAIAACRADPSSPRQDEKAVVGTHRVEPVRVQDLLGVGALGYQYCPLAAKLTGGILPLWLHALLE